MAKFIAVDSGKYATKVAVYDPVKKETKKFKFRTKMSEGNFLDDAIESGTFIGSYEKSVYKIGNGAKIEAELNTSKKSEFHKICTLMAIAMCVTEKNEEVTVAIGIPVKEFGVVEKRQEYKDYILPDGNLSIGLKLKSDSPQEEKTFHIVSKSVYPESAGALYLDMKKYADNSAAIIDLGNLNINCTCWQNFELDGKYTITDELGGNILISNLSQELSAEFSRCDENLVAKILKLPPKERYLRPIKPNKEIEEKSAKIIKSFLLNHVKEIKRKCDSKQWSLDYMQLVFIGGTSELLKDEIKEIFGEEVTIPVEPEYANVVGFLRRLCANKLKMLIPIADDKEILQKPEN